MRIAFTYASVVLLWATTPLAIKWSGLEAGFLFGVTLRMLIGTVCLLVILLLSKQRLSWDRQAWQCYLVVAIHLYGGMLAVYWSAQFIPSGWVSVIGGLLPLFTALLAMVFLGEQRLTISKLLSYLLGIAGLTEMFGTAIQLNDKAGLGILSCLLAVLLHAVSSVLIKGLNVSMPALHKVTGGLLISMPLYLLTWKFTDGQLPENLSIRTLGSIAYLGVIATPFGFGFYYYLLKHLSVTRVNLISISSPPLALILGQLVNDEPITEKIILGAALILTALFVHEFIGRKN